MNWFVTSLGGNVSSTGGDGTTVTVRFPRVASGVEIGDEMGSLNSVLGTHRS